MPGVIPSMRRRFFAACCNFQLVVSMPAAPCQPTPASNTDRTHVFAGPDDPVSRARGRDPIATPRFYAVPGNQTPTMALV